MEKAGVWKNWKKERLRERFRGEKWGLKKLDEGVSLECSLEALERQGVRAF